MIIHLIFLKDTFNSMYIKVSLSEVSIIMILKMMKLMINLILFKDTFKNIFKSIYLKVSSYEVSINKIL